MAAQATAAQLAPQRARTPDVLTGKRIPSLDGMRAISITLVILGHLCGTQGFPISHEAMSSIAPIGSFGVRVFFVISGFLITTLLLQETEKTGTISITGFYMRRLLRIFPANYFFVTAMWVASMLGLVALNRMDVLHGFTYTMNYHMERSWFVAHLWSLSVEEQFYMIWPALLRKINARNAVYVCIGVLLAAPAIRVAELALTPGRAELVGHSFETVFDSLASGCLLALLWTRLGERADYQKFLQSALFWLVPAAVLGALVASRSWKFDNLVGQTVLNVGIAVILERFVRYSDDAPGRVLNWKPLQMIGVWSYSLYLWQQPFLNREHPGFWTAFPVNIGCALALALGSYYLVELPFLGLRKRFR